MRFKFRLEAALRVAKRSLENERRRLAEELEKLRQQEALVKAQENRYQQAIEGQRDAGKREPQSLGRWQQYAVHLRHDLIELQQKLKQQEKTVQAQRLQVIKAHQAYEKLHKLKAKQEAAFWLNEQRREQRILDEAGQVIFQRHQEQPLMIEQEGTHV